PRRRSFSPSPQFWQPHSSAARSRSFASFICQPPESAGGKDAHAKSSLVPAGIDRFLFPGWLPPECRSDIRGNDRPHVSGRTHSDIERDESRWLNSPLWRRRRNERSPSGSNQESVQRRTVESHFGQRVGPAERHLDRNNISARSRFRIFGPVRDGGLCD